MGELVKQSAYARHHGVSRQAVSKAVARGRLRLHGGLVDVAEADAALGPAPGGVVAAGVATDYHAAKARKMAADADLAELRLAVERGRMVDAQQVAADWHRVLRTTRDRILAVPARVAADLAAIGDAARVRIALDAELRVALHALADEVAAMATADP